MSPAISQLIQFFARLPGLGPRSARRISVHLLKNQEKVLAPLLQILTHVHQKLVHCGICGNWDTQTPCTICQNPKRDPYQLCIIETIADLWALERAQVFCGYYHILGGVLSALDGVTPKNLNTDSLLERLRPPSIIQEVIIATNSTMEGQTTMHYVMGLLAEFNIKITMLAQGVPVGGELDFLDQATLFSAFFSRQRR